MSNKKSPEYLLKVNGFKNQWENVWILANDFGTIIVYLEDQEIAFVDAQHDDKGFRQQYDAETFDTALVQTYMRSGMYDYLRKGQGGDL